MNFVKVTSSAVFYRVRSCPLHVRWFCSRDDPGDSQNQAAPDRYIPERVKRRLKARGLTEDNLDISKDSLEKAKYFTSLNIQQALKDSVVEKNINIEFPSDINSKHTDGLGLGKYEKRHSVDPATESVLLFPGQGSQFVGMGKKLLSYPDVEELYDKASNILGYDLLNVCINGPAEKLNKTVYCQPAVVVTSLAALERLKEDMSKTAENFAGAAGFSVGEYTAMIASGMLSFEDALYLIKVRAQVMQAISERVNGGMMTVVCDHRSNLRVAMVAAREYCSQRLGIDEPVCNVAIYLCSNIKVIAGNVEALDFIKKYGKEWHLGSMKRLPVSGPFHTDLMNDQSDDYFKFWNALDKVTVNKPKFSVYSNIDGSRYRVDDTISGMNGLKHIMRKQLYRPVKWEQTMHGIFKRPDEVSYPQVYEVGPGRQLGYLLKKTNAKAFETYKNIEC